MVKAKRIAKKQLAPMFGQKDHTVFGSSRAGERPLARENSKGLI